MPTATFPPPEKYGTAATGVNLMKVIVVVAPVIALKFVVAALVNVTKQIALLVPVAVALKISEFVVTLDVVQVELAPFETENVAVVVSPASLAATNCRDVP